MLTSQGGFVGGHTLYKLISVCTHSNIDIFWPTRYTWNIPSWTILLNYSGWSSLELASFSVLFSCFISVSFVTLWSLLITNCSFRYLALKRITRVWQLQLQWQQVWLEKGSGHEFFTFHREVLKLVDAQLLLLLLSPEEYHKNDNSNYNDSKYDHHYDDWCGRCSIAWGVSCRLCAAADWDSMGKSGWIVKWLAHH